MLDLTWKLFSQTGNIETYLLFKELENGDGSIPREMKQGDNQENKEIIQKLF